MKESNQYEILVIEDNLGDYVLIEDYLEDHMKNLTLTHVSTFQKALEKLIELQNHFDAILLDLTLPDSKGETLIQDILKVSGEVPVIVLTGYSDMTLVTKSLEYGISDYLLKDELTALSLFKSIIYNIERKKSTLTIIESEQRYSKLFHLSPIPMWVYDTETLQILDVNQAAINHYGYSEEEFLSMKISKLMESEDQFEHNLEIKESSSIGKKHINHKKKNGELISVDTRSNHILFKGKDAVVVLANDITEIHRYVEAIELQNKRLQEIAWTQSHVVRAPVARIMGLIKLLESLPPDDEDRNDILKYILDSTNELDQIIKEITRKTEEITPSGYNVE